MNKVINTPKYVSLNNNFMKMAYNIGKTLYNKTKWNLKTTPIAIIVKDGKIVATGIAGYGNHVLEQSCLRLGKSGTPYDICKWCTEIYHAEQIAIENAGKTNLNGAELYLYGHYHFCDSCTNIMQKVGIKNVYLLENSKALFDRHNPNTILGTKEQFCDII